MNRPTIPDVLLDAPPWALAWLVFVVAVIGGAVVHALHRRDLRRLRLRSDAIDEGVIVHDNGRPSEFNDAILRMTGYTREEFGRLNLVESIVHPESRDTILASIRAGNEKPYRAQGMRKDGASFPAEVRPKILRTAFGKIRIVVIRDLSSLHAAEVAREESDDRYRLVMDCAVEAIALHRDGVAVDVNAAYCRMFGRPREALVGADILALDSLDQKPTS